LVQSVYPVSDGAGLAVTTARYYTPSGRLIQRPWDGTFDEYLTYTLRDQDPAKVHRPEELKFTDGGRRVYSGGGIDPDRRFDGPTEGFNPTRFGRSLAARNLFDTFAQRFSRAGDSRITANRTTPARDLSETFTVTDELLAEFKAHVQQARVRIDEAAWRQDEAFIRAMLRYEIDVDLFGVAVARKNLSKQDPQLQYALTLFPEADALMHLSKSSSPSRQARR